LGKTIEDRQRFNTEICGFKKKIEKIRDGVWFFTYLCRDSC
jgi:hypothetical protein